MTGSAITADSKLTSSDTRHRVWVIAGAPSGSPIEWFDFYVYSFCSLHFAHIFFPSGSTTTQLLQAAGAFAAGFLMRPIGSWLFGRIADKHGRKESMLLSVCVMCFGSLAIACLPGHGIIGTWAPALLLLAHLLQELSVGGEHGTNATYMSEVAVEGCKGFYTSFQCATLIGGQLLVLLVVVVLQHTMEDAVLRRWGWRIPFALGTVLAVVALWLRRQLDEASQQEAHALKETGSLKGLWHNRHAFIMILGFIAAGSPCFCTFTTYTQKYLVNTAGMHANVVSGVMTAALFVFMLVRPLIDALSDKIGRRTSVLCFGSLATIFTAPILSALQNVSSPYAVFGLMMCTLLVMGFCTSISGILRVEMFPAQVRALDAGLSYAVANAIFDGSAEYVMLSLKSIGVETVFFWYVTLIAVVAFLVSLTLHRKRKEMRLQ